MSIDFKDVMLEAQAEVMEFFRELEVELEAPKVDAQMRLLWRSLPESMKERYRIERPDEYNQMMKAMTSKGDQNASRKR